MISYRRTIAFAKKEWRLSFRFAVTHLMNSLVGPMKTMVVVLLVYRNFQSNSSSALNISGAGYQIFLYLGTMCHFILSSSSQVFINRISMEKHQLTFIATYISPASLFEYSLGHLLGAGGIQIFASCIMCVIAIVIHPIGILSVIAAILCLICLLFVGAGLGIIQATIQLCYPEKSSYIEYGYQVLIFLSCFYFPVEALPSFVLPFAEILPTFVCVKILRELFSQGFSPQLQYQALILFAWACAAVYFPIHALDRAIRRDGVAGY